MPNNPLCFTKLAVYFVHFNQALGYSRRYEWDAVVENKRLKLAEVDACDTRIVVPRKELLEEEVEIVERDACSSTRRDEVLEQGRPDPTPRLSGVTCVLSVRRSSEKE